VLGGRLDHDAGGDRAPPGAERASVTGLLAVSSGGLLARVAGALLLAGFGLLTIAEAAWAHALGVVALLSFIVCGFLAAVPSLLPTLGSEDQ
jgi:cytochrome d ubiquinol oxidase subunit II